MNESLDIVCEKPCLKCHPALVAGSRSGMKEMPQSMRHDAIGWQGYMQNHYYVYILTNASHTVFYTGVTNDLIRRIYEHKHKLIEGFTKKYNLHKLVYYEMTEDVNAALHREKLIKKWKREFKFDAIKRLNPNWDDLYDEMVQDPATSAG